MRPPTTVGTGCTTPPKLATRSRARVPFRTACSDGETEHAEEYQHLWGDAVYGAVDDADDGDREATRNIRHANPLFLGDAGRDFVAALLGTIEFRREDQECGGARPSWGRCRRRS